MDGFGFFRATLGAMLCLVVMALTGTSSTHAAPAFPGTVSDYHGYVCHEFTVDGCPAKLVEPKQPASSHPWIWRAMFWDAFPGVDLAMLQRGFYLAFIDVGDTFGSPESIRHCNPFYAQLTSKYGLSRYPALEGLSRGGMFIYHWAALNPDKVGCIFGDAPLCDIKIWPRKSIKDPGADQMWSQVVSSYRFASLDDALSYEGNPVDDAILAPLAAAHIPIIHLIGDADSVVVPVENTEVVRAKYLKMGGPFFEIVKHGCDHHPHGLSDPTVIADYIVAHAGTRPQPVISPRDRSGEILILAPNQWQ